MTATAMPRISCSMGLTASIFEPCILGRANRKVPIRYDATFTSAKPHRAHVRQGLKDWQSHPTRIRPLRTPFMTNAICIA